MTTIRCLIFILLTSAGVARAGVVIEMVDRDTQTGKITPSQKIYAQGGVGRMEDADGAITIVRGDSMLQIDAAKKSYRVIDKKAMDAMAARMAEMRKQAEGRMAKMPPEQRAKMQQAFGDGTAKDWKVETLDTGKSDRVEGRTCRVWQIKRQGVLDDELCLISYSELPGKGELQTLFRNMAALFDQMAKSMPQIGRGVGNEFRAQGKLDGFPIRTRSYTNGKLDPEESLVKSWKEQAIPAAMFEPPAGYKRREATFGGDDDDDE